MAFALIKRLIKGSPLSHAEHDQNLTDIEVEVAGLKALIAANTAAIGNASNPVEGIVNGVFDSNVTTIDHDADTDNLTITYESGYKITFAIAV
jgi:hypothetical protein